MKLDKQGLLAGAAAGAVNGFWGGGGGMVLVPLLTGRCGLSQRQAFATSVAIILPLSVISVVIYGLSGNLEWQTALPYLAGGALGGLVGGRLFQRIPVSILRRIFALFILYGGLRALFFK